MSYNNFFMIRDKDTFIKCFLKFNKEYDDVIFKCEIEYVPIYYNGCSYHKESYEQLAPIVYDNFKAEFKNSARLFVVYWDNAGHINGNFAILHKNDWLLSNFTLNENDKVNVYKYKTFYRTSINEDTEKITYYFDYADALMQINYLNKKITEYYDHNFIDHASNKQLKRNGKLI